MRDVIKRSAAALSAASMIFALSGCSLFGPTDLPDPPPTCIELSETELRLKVGESKTLAVDADGVLWQSGNDNIATVDGGTVTGVAVGKTTVYAFCDDAEASCAVTVVEDCGTDDPELIKQGYKLIWHDEFDGDALDMSNWSYQTGTRDDYGGNQGPANWGNDEMQYYSENNVKVSVGMLTISAVKEAEKVGGKSYTSGRITSRGKFSLPTGISKQRSKRRAATACGRRFGCCRSRRRRTARTTSTAVGRATARSTSWR